MLFESTENICTTTALGSSRNLRSGIDSTKDRPGNCDPGWFPGDGTVILGGDTVDRALAKSHRVSAEWIINIAQNELKRTTGGYLVVGCQRSQGGLHSKKHGAEARIFLNDQQLDTIRLKVIPANHTDYFHRLNIQAPSQGWPWPFSACGTLYAWPIASPVLLKSCLQKVVIEIDGNVGWDIDYVGLVLVTSSKKLSEFGKNMIYLLIGAILSYLVALVTLL